MYVHTHVSSKDDLVLNPLVLFVAIHGFRSKFLVLQNRGVMVSPLFLSAERLAGAFSPICLLFLSSPHFPVLLCSPSLQSTGEGRDFFAREECLLTHSPGVRFSAPNLA